MTDEQFVQAGLAVASVVCLISYVAWGAVYVFGTRDLTEALMGLGFLILALLFYVVRRLETLS